MHLKPSWCYIPIYRYKHSTLLNVLEKLVEGPTLNVHDTDLRISHLQPNLD